MCHTPNACDLVGLLAHLAAGCEIESCHRHLITNCFIDKIKENTCERVLGVQLYAPGSHKPSLDSGLNSGLDLQKLNVRLAKMLKSAVVLLVKPFSYICRQQIYPGSFGLKVEFLHACTSLYVLPFIDMSMQKPRM